ncbi:MAG: GDPmannose 4,6-dehydratase, partial [Mycobacterium sp.]|nr:GDPmannose 4,6-dehydratase [Mycobacterium sp.]
ASRARDKLGWEPTVFGHDLARLMVDADVEALAHARTGRRWIDTVRLGAWGSPTFREAAV